MSWRRSLQHSQLLCRHLRSERLLKRWGPQRPINRQRLHNTRIVPLCPLRALLDSLLRKRDRFRFFLLAPSALLARALSEEPAKVKKCSLIHKYTQTVKPRTPDRSTHPYVRATTDEASELNRCNIHTCPVLLHSCRNAVTLPNK